VTGHIGDRDSGVRRKAKIVRAGPKTDKEKTISVDAATVISRSVTRILAHRCQLRLEDGDAAVPRAPLAVAHRAAAGRGVSDNGPTSRQIAKHRCSALIAAATEDDEDDRDASQEITHSRSGREMVAA
jgi:hypothetical protein